MPILQHSNYTPPLFFKNPHIQSVFPQVFRKITGILYTRERIETPDQDFIDLDWCSVKSPRCVILAHGLEGHTHRPYVLGMAKAFHKRGWSSVSMSFRGCSGEPNRLLRSYHHGVSDDLATVVDHVAAKGYTTIAVVGFSLGGNVLLKYLGEQKHSKPDLLCGGVAISAPCDLAGCAKKMDQPSHSFYTKRFLKMLHEKIIDKKKIFPDLVNDEGYEKIVTFREYDDRYTAPMQDFKDSQDYYTKAASLQYLHLITTPVLLLNAKDDPFLTPECSPEHIASSNSALFLERPDHGGHVGFIAFNKENEYWSETRAVDFITQTLSTCGSPAPTGIHR
jgi:predicted alpha/beta-fold hydrolase